MKKIYQFHVLVLIILFYFSCENSLFAVSYTWNGSVSSEWSTASNWSPVGVPDLLDDVTINGSGAFQPLWEELPGIRNLTMTGGIFNLQGFNVNVSGNCLFNGGVISNGTLIVSGNSATFSGTEFNCNVTYSGPNALFNGSVFHGAVQYTKIGGGVSYSTGGNTFNGPLVISNSTTSQIRFGTVASDIYHGTVSLNNQSTGGIFMAYSSLGNVFNGNIEVSSSNSTGIRFGQNGGSSLLASGRTISIGSGGFSAGDLRLAKFTYSGTIPLTLTGSGTSAIYFENSSVFEGIVTIEFPHFYLNGSQFNNELNILKTGNNTCSSSGGNLFNGKVTITKAGNGWIRISDITADVFNGDLFIYASSGNSGIELSRTATGNQYNGNINISCVVVNTVSFGANNGTSSLASDKTIQLYGLGFTDGTLRFRNIAQLGSSAISLIQASGNSTLVFEQGCLIQGDLSLEFPSLNLTRSTFNGNIFIHKSSGPNAACVGGNTFNGTLEITNSSANAFYMGNGLPDVYNGIVTLKQWGNNYIFMSHAGPGNIYNNQVILNSYGSSRGIRFGSGGGTSQFTDISSIQIGSNGYSTGELFIYNSTVECISPLNLSALTGNAVFASSSSSFNSNLLIRFPRISLSNSVFNSETILNKIGTGNDTWTGGNIFHGNTTIKVDNAYIIIASLNPETYNGITTFHTTGSALIYLAHTAAGNAFNDHVYLYANGIGSSILLGQAGGTSAIASGKLLAISGDFISRGTIRLKNVTQTGSETLTLDAGSSDARLYFENAATFNGNLNVISGSIFLNGATFNSTANFNQTGAASVTCTGGNLFGGLSTFENSGTNLWQFANTNPDNFSQAISLICSNLNARINIAHNGADNNFGGNIALSSYNGALGIRFCGGTGTAVRQIGSTMFIGAGGFSSGDLFLRNINQLGNEPNNLILPSTATSLNFLSGNTFRGQVNVEAPRVFLSGSEFMDNSNFLQTGAVSVSSAGGNRFKGNTTISVSGAGSWTTATLAPDIFEGICRINNSGNGAIIYLANTVSGNVFQGDIILTSTNGAQGVRFGQGAMASASFNGSISIGLVGFTSGNLELQSMVQTSALPNSLILNNSATSLYIEPGTVFLGDLTAQAGRIYLHGASFQTTTLTQNGNVSVNANGGNTFNGPVQFNLSGSGYWLMANSFADTYQSTVEVVNTGSSQFYFAHNSAGNTFNGAIKLNSTGSSQGIVFCQGTVGSATLNASALLSIGTNGFSSGVLRLRRITQNNALATILNLTGSADAYFELGNSFNGDVTCSGEQVFLNGSAFNHATFNQFGSINSSCTGGNTFNLPALFNLSGPGNWVMANNTADNFNSSVEVVNTGSGLFYFAHNSTGNNFNGEIKLSSTGLSQGIVFCQGTVGSAAISASGFLSLGSGGFSSGVLRLRRITQSNAISSSLNLTGTADLYFEVGNTFTGNITGTAEQVYLNGSTFNSLTVTQFGNLITYCTGGNLFNGAVTLNLTGSSTWIHSNTTADVYNSTLSLNSSGSGLLHVAYSGVGTEFRGNLSVTSTGSSQGVRFGQNGGQSTLVGASQFAIGGAGFTSGSLRIRRLIQQGITPINIAIPNSAVQIYLETGNVFNGNATLSSANLFLNGSTFNAQATLTNSGSSIVACAGGNTFNGITQINATGTGQWRLASTSSDNYNASVLFKQSVATTLYPAYNAAINILSDISTVNSTFAITFAPNNNAGYLVFGGGANQQFHADAAKPPVVPNLLINKSAGTLTLRTSITIDRNFNLVNGVIVSTGANLLSIADNVIVTGGSTASHVSGPIRKIGNDAFIFPTGKGGVYRPISISAPSNTLHHFTAELFRGSSNGLYPHSSRDASIQTISQCEFWILDRTNGNANVSVGLGWNGIECSVVNTGTLTVARWNGSTWKDHGNGGTSGSPTSGTITSAGAISSFSPFAVASTSAENPLPVELVSFNATPVNENVIINWSTASELNSNYFEVERSEDLINFQSLGRIYSAGNANWTNNYSLLDHKPSIGINYYRLIQVDFNGEKTMFDPISVEYKGSSNLDLILWPNPTVGQLTIQVNNSTENKTQIIIRDALGFVASSRIIDLDRCNKLEFNFESLPNGMYSVHLINKNGSVIKKFIKQ